MPFVDPRRYGHIMWGPLDARPNADHVPTGQVYAATDVRKIYLAYNGEWLEIADLTAALEWDEILNKPNAFPPVPHDLEGAHTGTLLISRIRGHDQLEPSHLRAALMGMVIGQI